MMPSTGIDSKITADVHEFAYRWPLPTLWLVLNKHALGLPPATKQLASAQTAKAVKFEWTNLAITGSRDLYLITQAGL